MNGSWCGAPVPLPLDAVVAVGSLLDPLEEAPDALLDDALGAAGVVAGDELGGAELLDEPLPLELDPEPELELELEPDPEPEPEPPWEPPEAEGGWVYWLSPADPPPSASVTAGAASASRPSRPSRIVNWRLAVMA